MVTQRAFDYGVTEDPHAPRDDAGSVGDYRLLCMLLGTLIGAGIASLSFKLADSPAERDQWLIFLLIAGLLGAAAGEAFGFGMSRWFEVQQYHSIKRWRVTLSVVMVLIIAAALIASTNYVFANKETLTSRGIALSALAIAGGLPTAATLAAIKQVCADPLPGGPGAQLSAMLRLRQMSTRMLSQLGVLVLLIMGVNGAAANWGDIQQNPKVVIFSGVVASFIIAIMYVPTASALRRRGAIFVGRHFSLADTPTDQLASAAEDRQKLEKMLGLDQTTFGELKAGFVVLTPVVVGLVATLLKAGV